MALVRRPSWVVGFGFIDNNENVARVSTRLPATLTAAEVDTRMVALGAALQDISDARLFTADATLSYFEDAPVAITPTSEVERKLVIPLGTEDTPNATEMEVPSPRFTLEIDGTDVVNPADADLVVLLGLLTAGSIGPGNGSVTYYGADITRAGRPVIRHRNRRARR